MLAPRGTPTRLLPGVVVLATLDRFVEVVVGHGLLGFPWRPLARVEEPSKVGWVAGAIAGALLEHQHLLGIADGGAVSLEPELVQDGGVQIATAAVVPLERGTVRRLAGLCFVAVDPICPFHWSPLLQWLQNSRCLRVEVTGRVNVSTRRRV